jgi:hypothetical protein
MIDLFSCPILEDVNPSMLEEEELDLRNKNPTDEVIINLDF